MTTASLTRFGLAGRSRQEHRVLIDYSLAVNQLLQAATCERVRGELRALRAMHDALEQFGEARCDDDVTDREKFADELRRVRSLQGATCN